MNSVYITCEKDLSGAIEVTYAGADEFKGHGNLRDSDDYEGPLFCLFIVYYSNEPMRSMFTSCSVR